MSEDQIKEGKNRFPGWELYFADEHIMSYDEPTVDVLFEVIGALMRIFSTSLRRSIGTKETVEKNNFVVPLNCGDIRPGLGDPDFSLEPNLTESPDLIVNAIGLALWGVLYGSVPEQDRPYRRVIPRLYHKHKVLPIRKLKSTTIGQFVSLSGTVIRTSNIKPMVVALQFECSKCSMSIRRPIFDGKFSSPSLCPGCRGTQFHLQRELAETIDWQKIRLQELMTGDQYDSGRVPRTVECELTRDLVDQCVPGDTITVCGVVKKVNIGADRGGRGNKNKAMYYIYVDTNSLDNGRRASVRAPQLGYARPLDFSLKMLRLIRMVANEPNLFTLIVNSLCPGIYGHECVKAGLILTLFGGVQRHTDSPDKLPVRGDPHMLIVGDPGLGKSQMLQAVTATAPRGVYVCGSYSSTSGLTVTLLKESGTGDYTLEAGALVLGDQGACCIDEFDKMGKEHQALLEAMEQQSISVAKAGIVCSLPARTSVIAAANPTGGHYQRHLTISENLKINEAILSRFDLIFLLLDKPDDQRDRMISEHVMRIHADGRSPRKRARISSSPRNPFSRGAGSSKGGRDGRPTLESRLRWPANEKLDPIPTQVLRKYIEYARKFVQPELSKEASDVLQEFFIHLRSRYQSADGTPITTRQLESLVRLATARAKAELREIVTREDAEDVVMLMKESLFDVMEQDFGCVDLRKMTGLSMVKQVKQLVKALEKLSKRNGTKYFTNEQLSEMGRDLDISEREFKAVIDMANRKGFLVLKSDGYELLSN